MSKLRTIFAVFISAFFLNLIWENLHSFLYVHYKGGEITEFILLRATLSDAVYISLAAILILIYSRKRVVVWLSVLALLILSIVIERLALGSGRWAYNSLMPIVPILHTGLTPTIQLAILGYLSFRLSGLTWSISPVGYEAESHANLK
jgi:hypothetical protein